MSLDDRSQIEALIARFFAAFGTPRAHAGDLGALRELFVPEALIVKWGATGPEFMALEAFLAPREALFRSGRLREFREWELDHATELFSDIAQRRSRYAKSWTVDGQRFEEQGVKLLQLVRTRDGWRLSSLCWQDDPHPS